MKGLPINFIQMSAVLLISAALCKVHVKQNLMCKLVHEVHTPIYIRKDSCLSVYVHYSHTPNVDTSVSFKMCQISLENLYTFLAYRIVKFLLNAVT